MQELVLATGNPGKLKELQALLQDMPLRLRAQAEFAVAEAEETGLSFVENAILKARNAARHTGLPAIADDSGLAVAALHGAPGIHSARYAGPNAADGDNVAKLLAALAAVPEPRRQASFHCVIVFMRHAEDPVPLCLHGRWRGRIARAPRGSNGFGYDPVFIPAGGARTAAELPAAEKQRYSHRAQAVKALAEALRGSSVAAAEP